MTYRLIGCAIVALTITAASFPNPVQAVTDPNVLCHKTVVQKLEKYKRRT